MLVPAEGFAWIDVVDAKGDEIGKLQRIFGLYDLAVEDSAGSAELAKVDVYSDHAFIAATAEPHKVENRPDRSLGKWGRHRVTTYRNPLLSSAFPCEVFGDRMWETPSRRVRKRRGITVLHEK